MPSSMTHSRSQWPDDIGIQLMEFYFPNQYVCQHELETFDGVSKGKYTIGLGQQKMGFCSDREDVISMCMTALSNLMRKNNLSYNDIGRLDVGTESIIDKSKSIKSALMKLFEESDNTDIEGVDSINACYGGTAALFNAVNWIESSSWDGRFAVVVAGDNAVYDSGPARPTGGAGAVAMLIGPNAPLVLERGVRSSYMKHTYDFYKPNLASEYPVVDGSLSIKCYFSSLDSCYQTYLKKASTKQDGASNLNDFDHLLFHSPYCKLVQKAFGRLTFIQSKSLKNGTSYSSEIEKHRGKALEDTYFDKELEKAFVNASLEDFQRKTKPSLLLASQVGNMYTPSVYGGLASLLACTPPQNLSGKRIGIFSYGSGLASSFFSIMVSNDLTADSKLQQCLATVKDIPSKLLNRTQITPVLFTSTLRKKQEAYNKAPYYPSTQPEDLLPGTWYLESIDEKHRRTYQKYEPIFITNNDNI